VFSNEPPSADLELISLSQDIVTPHLGASTEEAQVLVAVDVAEQIVAVLSGGVARSPVNLPTMSPDIAEKIGPYLNLAEKMGSMLAQLAREPVLSLNIQFAGDWDGLPTDPVTRAALAGLLSVQLNKSVNLVNAPVLADQRGIKWSQTVSSREGNYSTSIKISVKFPMREHNVNGAVFGRSDCRITHIDGFAVDIVPEGFMLITSHRDTPGMIGKVGTILGDKGINIARMHVGREVIGGRAITALQVDEEVPPATLNQIRQIQGMDQVVLVTL
jgi:D-3-phosphoglycerate dehydrogenase